MGRVFLRTGGNATRRARLTRINKVTTHAEHHITAHRPSLRASSEHILIIRVLQGARHIKSITFAHDGSRCTCTGSFFEGRLGCSLFPFWLIQVDTPQLENPDARRPDQGRSNRDVPAVPAQFFKHPQPQGFVRRIVKSDQEAIQIFSA